MKQRFWKKKNEEKGYCFSLDQLFKVKQETLLQIVYRQS